MVRIRDAEDVVEGVNHDLPEILSNLAVIDEVFGSLRWPVAVGTGIVIWRVSELVP